MLWCVLSDVHGNAVALKAVLNDLRKYNIAGIIGLGDYIGECGESEKVLELLQENNVMLVRGNREEALVQLWNNTNPQIEKSLQFKCGALISKQVKKTFYDTIVQLPMTISLQMGLQKALFTHGTQHNISELVYPSDIELMDNILENMDEDVFANGHSHMSWKHTRGMKLGFNSGSVGLQHDGVPGQASYALLEIFEHSYEATIMKTPIDVVELETNMTKSGWMDECGILARLGLDEVKTGQKHILPFVCFAYDYYEKAMGINEGIIPNDLWDAASRAWLLKLCNFTR